MAVIPKPYRDFKRGAPPPDSRQKVLAQWRGTDLAPIEKARAIRVTRAGDFVPRLLSKWGVERRQSEAEGTKVWKNLLVPAIVGHARPTGVHKGTLFVTVDSSVWLSEIVRYRRREILDRL